MFRRRPCRDDNLAERLREFFWNNPNYVEKVGESASFDAATLEFSVTFGKQREFNASGSQFPRVFLAHQLREADGP